jgi:hypothetical protein
LNGSDQCRLIEQEGIGSLNGNHREADCLFILILNNKAKVVLFLEKANIYSPKREWGA